MVTAIILAAGSSSRYQSKTPKQFSLFNNRMIIDYSINTFYKHKNIDKVILVVSESYKNQMQNEYPHINVITGGKRRQDSSRKGILSCNKNTSDVLIHDAARAMISDEIIDRCLYALKKYEGVAPAIPSENTLANIDSDETINDIPNRKNIYQLQTPQCFRYKTIINCFNKFEGEVTDDISILIQMGYKCGIVKGSKMNFKITTQDDIKLLKNYYE